jgi:hypothetical protein
MFWNIYQFAYVDHLCIPEMKPTDHDVWCF